MRFDGKKIRDIIDKEAWEALSDVSEGVLTVMVNEAPIKKGTLRRMHDIIRNPAKGTITFVANTPYAEAVHEGSKPHIIKPKKAKALWWAGLTHPVGGVKHPGNKANPWMHRTMDKEADRIDEYILDRVELAIGKGLDDSWKP